MKLFILFLATFYVLLPNGESITIVSRKDWGAEGPKHAYTKIKSPVGLVIIHHTETTGCHTEDACKRSMRSTQRYHKGKWNDFGYHFAVGGDGNIYEGRGWGVEGAHAISYNRKSVGICAIGNFDTETPTNGQLQSIKDLIKEGVTLGKISSDYTLIGHRQVNKDKTCPGNNLWNEISSWSNFNSTSFV